MTQRIRTSAIVVHNNHILTFFAVDPSNNLEYHFLPGGKIEKNETAPEAAIRETFEETGYEITIETATALDKQYPFHWNSEDYLSLTIFYRGYLKNPFQKPTKVSDAEYNKEVRWIPISKVNEIFNYCQEIKEAVLEITQS